MNDTPEIIETDPNPEGPSLELLSKEVRNWAMACHLTSLAMFTTIPGANILGPLIVWLAKREDHPFIDAQGKESINFQISMFIYGLVAASLMFVCVGFVILPALVVVDVVLVIIAAIKTSDGEAYRYPLTIRLVK